MHRTIPVAGGQLLENIHIPELEIVVRIDVVIEAHKKAVLIEVVVYNRFSKVYMHFIIQYKGKRFGCNAFFA